LRIRGQLSAVDYHCAHNSRRSSLEIESNDYKDGFLGNPNKNPGNPNLNNNCFAVFWANSENLNKKYGKTTLKIVPEIQIK
jgi:hypothetical protein